MLNYVDLLVGWAASWKLVERPVPSVDVQLGEPSAEKRSAWLLVEGEGVAGQLTVWESGECELEAYRIVGGGTVLLEHRDLSTAEELGSACCALVDACGGVAE